MSRLNSFLQGVKVLDLSRYLPGPLATLLLADMGADVLKVEAPAGDGMRDLGPRDPQGKPLFYNAINAGKSVVRLNLRDEQDRQELLGLVAEADVLIEGFRPGVMARLGLAYDRLKAVNPRLIYCALSGYGATGPMTYAAGHDGNYLAAAGVLHRNEPALFDPPVADSSGSLFAALTIVGALHGRARDGRGCEIDLSMTDAVMPLQLFRVADYGANGAVPEPASDYLNGGAAYYRHYRTRDGAGMVLGAIEPKFWSAFCTAADKAEWIDRQTDPMPQTALIAELEDYFAGLTREACLERFADVDCCLSPVLDLGEAMTSDQVRQRQLVRAGEEGALQALYPARLDGAPPRLRAAVRQLSPAEARAEFTSSACREA